MKLARITLILPLLIAGAAGAQVRVEVTDPLGSASIKATPGQEVTLQVRVGSTAQDIQGLDMTLDLTSITGGAPPLEPEPQGNGVSARLGAIFSTSSATTDLSAREVAPGRVKVMASYQNIGSPANGPGCLLEIPVRVPATAPDGSSWAVKVTDDTGGNRFTVSSGQGPLPLGTLLSAAVYVGEKPPASGVDVLPPEVSIVSPAPGSYARGELTVQVEATEETAEPARVGLKVLDIPGFLVETDHLPYSFTLSQGLLPDGEHQLVAQAIDAAGNVGESDVVKVIYDGHAPVLQVMGMDTSAYLVGGQVTLLARTSDETTSISKVVLFVDASLLNAKVLTHPNAGDDYQFTVDVSSLDEGYHAVGITSTDKAGNSANWTSSLHVDRTPPVAAIDAPTQGAKVRGAVSISGTASDGPEGWKGVRSFLLEAGKAGSESSFRALAEGHTEVRGGLLGRWDTSSLAAGDYVLRLTVEDKVGHQTQTTSQVTVVKTIPGDVDGNGSVGVKDALAVLKAVAGLVTLTDAGKAAADVDGNGKVDVKDAVKLLKMVAGLA
ncbi:MAG TPA: dockerin type I repeat-containing protein [Armatimonadota bacterium]